jgi:SAM-dependent methyltransferase
VYDARRLLEGAFDVAYVTWGAITWLPDIRRWAQVVASLLAPDGWLYLADAHPSAQILEEEDGRLAPRYAWRTPIGGPLAFDEPTSYTGGPTPLTHTQTYNWIHPLSEIVGGLLDAGLRLDVLREHEALPWALFPMMAPGGDRLYRLPDGQVPIPLAFSLKASRPHSPQTVVEAYG